jgi:hypothetical protein
MMTCAIWSFLPRTGDAPAIELLAPFTNTDVAADFVTQVAELAIKISEMLL